ncbi:MAG TPA: hypothetical protein VFZ60_03490 [Nitrososphaeraceae archaeon]|jgi:hypothetical protein
MVDTRTINATLIGSTERSINQKDDRVEDISAVIRYVQGLDIIISLQLVDCYSLPHTAMLPTINFFEIMMAFDKSKPTFIEVTRARTFKKKFGFYGYQILKLFLH